MCTKVQCRCCQTNHEVGTLTQTSLLLFLEYFWWVVELVWQVLSSRPATDVVAIQYISLSLFSHSNAKGEMVVVLSVWCCVCRCV